MSVARLRFESSYTGNMHMQSEKALMAASVSRETREDRALYLRLWKFRRGSCGEDMAHEEPPPVYEWDR